MRLTPETLNAWGDWMHVVNGRAHIAFEMLSPDLERHLELCLRNEESTVSRIRNAWRKDAYPETVLDIGCSAGLKAMAMQKQWPRAQIAGIDPDKEASALGRALADDPWMRARIESERMPLFKAGSGESLPWQDASFDLVTCITVIEHVADVARVVSEIARVLKTNGVAYIEAPNYIWPVECHLHILVPPLSPKWIMRLCARLQGQSKNAEFVNHLQLVHPFMLERLFRANGLKFNNESLKKLDAAASGDVTDVLAYGRAAKFLAALRNLGLAVPIAKMLGRIGLYPSLIYRVEKTS